MGNRWGMIGRMQPVFCLKLARGVVLQREMLLGITLMNGVRPKHLHVLRRALKQGSVQFAVKKFHRS